LAVAYLKLLFKIIISNKLNNFILLSKSPTIHHLRKKWIILYGKDFKKTLKWLNMLNNAAVFELFEIVYTYKINGKIIEKLFGTKKYHH